MKFITCVGIILAWASLQSALAQEDLDTAWLCRDTTSEYQFFKMYLTDTFPDNRGMFAMVDTGDKIDGNYINFNYKFTHDSVFLKDADSNIIRHSAPRPGYAGFKIFWDFGVQFYVTTFDSMILWHKGPLPGHKVMMIWAQGSAGCGTPINYEYFGQYTSSPVWKRESFPFPQTRGNSAQNPAPDSPFVKKGLFELRMLIYNDSIGGDTSSTSAPGNLKIDNMFFKKKGTGVGNAKLAPGAVGGPHSFVPKVSGQVMLAIFSLQGEQLFKESVDVTAGKKYDVSRFARKHSNLPVAMIQCIQITGSGVNITRKLVR